MESWRRAWQGSQLPVKPLEDIEWVEQHREWISALLDASSASSEAAAESYQAIQARWMLDYVRELERRRAQLIKQSSVVERRNHGKGILQLEYRANPKTGTQRGPYSGLQCY